jgi:lysophospholipase L1-like esterase
MYAGVPAPSSDAEKIAFPDPRLVVSGLPWFDEDKPVVRRLPARLKDSFREPVWALAQQPSGGRIRFRTDATKIGIIAKNPDASVMEHITSIGQNGFDIYADGEYLGSASPNAAGSIVREWTVGLDRKMRDITIYMPLYKAVTIQSITIEPNSKIEAPSPFKIAKPVVYYGSSITQGGCASNPGLSLPAILARWLNTDFVNLGFSGQGIGDESVAKAMTEIDASCFVLDHWANPSDGQYKDTLGPFVDNLRKKYPKTPILITGPYYNTRAATDKGKAQQYDSKEQIAKEFVVQRRKAGDEFISFVDGKEMLSREQAIGLVDGLHANSLGFYFCAKGLEPHLRKALSLTSP